MGKFCDKCGIELKEGAGFCSSCGTTVVQPPVMPAEQTPVEQPTPTEPEPLQISSDTLPDQQYGQTQAYVPPVQPKKSKKGLIVALVLVIVAVIVIAVVLLLFSGGLAGSAGQLEGTWEYNIGGISLLYKFNSDGSFEVGSGTTVPAGNWNVDGDQLCFSYSSAFEGEDSCYTYSISNNQLTLSYQGNTWMTLTKK